MAQRDVRLTLRFTCRAFNLEYTQALHESRAIRGQVQALVRGRPTDASATPPLSDLYLLLSCAEVLAICLCLCEQGRLCHAHPDVETVCANHVDELRRNQAFAGWKQLRLALERESCPSQVTITVCVPT